MNKLGEKLHEIECDCCAPGLVFYSTGVVCRIGTLEIISDLSASCFDFSSASTGDRKLFRILLVLSK